ncbi:hypothetical protein VP01_965g3 [Puccinia sorghi]|uniref:Uncharacterized protein n=1 Tax=Puccinia sorghi TaxID=27349 RepID=A0A0L6U634_9BASI|nr:hypothetical protein VP01_965g3 [Puccinia sorghi]
MHSATFISCLERPSRSARKVRKNLEKPRNTRCGSTKAALASEILSVMINAGITHRDNKGIQTKIQELQSSCSKARDSQRNTVSGLLDDDIANITSNLTVTYQSRMLLHVNYPAALIKIWNYWEELDPIMGTRTVCNPPITTDSTRRPREFIVRNNCSPDNPDTSAAQSEQTKGVANDDSEAHSTQTPTPAPATGSGSNKRKCGSKTGKDKVKAAADRDQNTLKLENQKIHILEMEAKMRFRHNEMIRQAKLEQFAQGEGTSWQEVDPTISDDNKESSEEDVASE